MASPIPIRRPPRDPELEKALPKNLDAERSILGAVLLDASQIPNKALRAATEFIRPEHFSLAQNSTIFRMMLRLDEDRQPIDLVTLSEALQSENRLESSGGVAYLSQLTDGIPRISNVPHYSKIVLDHAKLREIAYGTYSISDAALEHGARWPDLIERLATLRREVTNGMGAKLSAIDIHDFLTMELPAKEFVIEPLLTLRGFGMFFAQPGVGKTYFLRYLAWCIATGIPQCFYWKIPKARPVVYVEGEMPDDSLQERDRHILRLAEGRMPEAGYYKLITKDQQKQIRPKIATEEGRRAIEAYLQPGSVLFLDNLSSLCPDGDEETKNWEMVQDWLIDLTWQGIATILVHHSGNDADKQRGTTKRLDLLDFAVRMKKPSDYRQEDGLRAEVEIRKRRYDPADRSMLTPFELSLDGDTWLTKPLRDLLVKRCEEMLNMDLGRGEIAIELGMSRSQVQRIRRRMVDEGRLVEPGKSSPDRDKNDDPFGKRWDN